jgi:hypothetical protein
MCQIYLPEDTVNQCVKFTYQKTQSTNVFKLFTKRHSQPMCLKYKKCSEPKHQIDFWKVNLCAFLKVSTIQTIRDTICRHQISIYSKT